MSISSVKFGQLILTFSSEQVVAYALSRRPNVKLVEVCFLLADLS